MAIVNLILYRSNLWILQINYSLNALLKFSFPPRCTLELTIGKVLSLAYRKSVPVKCSADKLEEFLIWLVKIFMQFIEELGVDLRVCPAFGLV